ncbi:MAG: hypothetical protein M3387_10100 [Actinomycetota bacterium]|nr:hypothetical protein [Actinomycetota bacterium]
MAVSTLASAVGKGILAGLVGTAAMTVSSTLEAKATDRGASTTPADALEETFDIQPQDDDAEQRLNTLAHWGYGTAWGAVRGLLGAAGLTGPAAGATHFAAVWAAQQVMLPSLGVAKPAWQYGTQALATDLGHHAVYAAVTSLAYEWLDRRS